MPDQQQKPQLSSSWDPSGCRLTPAEGFLLSRIDGQTPLEQLRLIGGIPPEEVDRCLERWVSDGIVTFEASESSCNGQVTKAEPSGVAGDEADGFETGTDLSRDEQKRILEFEASLDRRYHVLLGVEASANTRDIKRAYFKLSREFHPDRHFGRKMGGFAPRIETIFMKIVEAYELLSDPATRSEIERSMSQMPPPEPPPEPTSEAVGSAGAAPEPPVDTKRAVLDRLRRHFRIPEKMLVERRYKAKQFHQTAMVSSRRGNWKEAGASIRLAIAFDPWNDEYKRSFAEVQARVHQVRAAELMTQADASLDARAQQDAMRMYEEALSYRPCDPEINSKAALLALELGENDAAREYADAAISVQPACAEHHRTLGKILRRMGLLEKAREALNQSLSIDPGDVETKSELAELMRMRSARSKVGEGAV
jgi:curved DNA-binding protein CbpA